MSSQQRTVDFILEQLNSLDNMTSRKMFGEYALYYDDKVVAFICDDSLFMKITEPGLTFLNASNFAPAYPGSKDYLKVPDEQLEESSWLCDFVKQTATALPRPQPKKPKTPKTSEG